MSDHEHDWGTAGYCTGCPERKCSQWKCPAPRVGGRSKCPKHTNGLTRIAPAEEPVPAVGVAEQGLVRFCHE